MTTQEFDNSLNQIVDSIRTMLRAKADHRYVADQLVKAAANLMAAVYYEQGYTDGRHNVSI